MIHLPKSPSVYDAMRRLPRMPALCGQQVSSRDVHPGDADCPLCLDRAAALSAPRPVAAPVAAPVAPAVIAEVAMEEEPQEEEVEASGEEGTSASEDEGDALAVDAKPSSGFDLSQVLSMISSLVGSLPAPPPDIEVTYAAVLERLSVEDRDALGTLMLGLRLSQMILPEPQIASLVTAQIQAFIVRLATLPPAKEEVLSPSRLDDLASTCVAQGQRLLELEARMEAFEARAASASAPASPEAAPEAEVVVVTSARRKTKDLASAAPSE